MKYIKYIKIVAIVNAIMLAMGLLFDSPAWLTFFPIIILSIIAVGVVAYFTIFKNDRFKKK